MADNKITAERGQTWTKWAVAGLTGLLGTIVGGVVIYALTTNRPDLTAMVRYGQTHHAKVMLSASVTDQQMKDISYFYEIEIENTGDQEATNIRLDIPGATAAQVDRTGRDAEFVAIKEGRVDLSDPIPPNETVTVIAWTPEAVSESLAERIRLNHSQGDSTVVVSRWEEEPPRPVWLVVVLIVLCLASVILQLLMLRQNWANRMPRRLKHQEALVKGAETHGRTQQ